MDTNCNDHPNQPHNQWGAGHPPPLHRQVMPPTDSDAGDWFWYWITFFAAIGFVSLIAWSAA